MRIIIKTFVPKAILAVTALTTMLTAASAVTAQKGGKKPAAKGPFTGVWDTRSAGSKFTVKLTQTGNKVAGTYSPYNGKIFGGVVTGNKLTFKWTQDGGYEGSGEFTLDDDSKGFTGTSTVVKPEPKTYSWSTYKPAPPRSFAGTWNLVNNIGVRVPLVLVQEGAKVTGFYPSQNGTIEGTVDGRTLQFEWVSDKGRGTGQIQISNSGETFGGTFPGFAESGWWGERSTEVMGFGGKKLGSYGGTWIVNESGPKGAMELKQSGAAVTGIYKTAKGIDDLQDATVNGTILRFVLIPRNEANSVRAGEIVVDGRSFKGAIDGISVTGTLKNP